MVAKAIYFLNQKYGLALDGEPWVIQKSNKAVETCILSLKIMENIRLDSFDKVLSFHQYHQYQHKHYFSFFFQHVSRYSGFNAPLALTLQTL